MTLAEVTVADGIVFFVTAAITLGSAIGVIFQRNPVHSAMFLVGTLFGVAVLFVLQRAHFLAAVQVIVYAGAIVVLFLFVIMLLGVDRRDDLHETLRFQRPIAFGLGILMVAMVIALGRTTWVTAPVNTDPATSLADGSGTVEALGRSLFGRFLFPFEVTSVLLVVAAVGAVVLARRVRAGEEDEERAEMEEVAG